MRTVWLAALVALGCGDGGLSFEAEAAEEMRELVLLRDVPVRTLSREEFAAEAAANANEISQDYLDEVADTYGRLGFFDRSVDLRPIFAGSSSDWVGASYSPGAGRITLVGDVIRADITVHEWVHALQDQHFDIGGFDALISSDSFLARRAIVEGDATLAQYRYIAVYDYDRELDGLDWESALAGNRERSVNRLTESEYPPLFLDYVSFVYTYGLEFTAHNLTGVLAEAPVASPPPHDWTREDRLFAPDAPVTTQAILTLGQADPVVPIGLEDVPAALADRFELVDWDSLGEWYTYLLLFPLDLDARAIAAAWDGDRALFVRDRASGAVATVWASVWDDDQSAQAIVDALWSLYGRTPIDGEPEHIATGDDGELAWIERRGNAVVAARNLPPDAAQALVDAAFAGPVSAAPRARPSLAQRIWQNNAVRCPTVR